MTVLWPLLYGTGVSGCCWAGAVCSSAKKLVQKEGFVLKGGGDAGEISSSFPCCDKAVSLCTLLAIRLGLEGSGKAAGTLRAPFFGDHGEKHRLHHLQDLLLSPSCACSKHLNEAPFICGHGERHGLLLGCSSIFKPAFERAPGRTQINASAVKCKPAIKTTEKRRRRLQSVGWRAVRERKAAFMQLVENICAYVSKCSAVAACYQSKL